MTFITILDILIFCGVGVVGVLSWIASVKASKRRAKREEEITQETNRLRRLYYGIDENGKAITLTEGEKLGHRRKDPPEPTGFLDSKQCLLAVQKELGVKEERE